MTDYTSAEFWKGAPEGATHYFEPFFYKAEGPRAWLFSDQWRLSSYSTRQIDESGVKRPAQPCPGDGLPPVGSYVEYGARTASVYPVDEWHEGDRLEVLAHRTVGDKILAVLFNARHQTASCLIDDYYRQIKTRAQIAAEERAAAIEAMWDIYWQPSATSAKQALGLLWDAGLRLPKANDD